MAHVAEVTEANFQSSIYRGRSDLTLLEIYAPWCPHCRAFVPEYEELAEKIRAKFGLAVQVARFDGTGNAIPRGIDIQYFPSFYILGPKLERAIPFNGPRNQAALESFVTKVVNLTAESAYRRK